MKELLDQLGLKIEMFKLIANSYKTSWFRMSGVLMRFGDIEFRVGPMEGAKELIAPSSHKLNLMDLNGAAVYAVLHDFMNSKLRTKGLSFLVDDILIRVGPQKDPLIIHPELIRTQSKGPE